MQDLSCWRYVYDCLQAYLENSSSVSVLPAFSLPGSLAWLGDETGREAIAWCEQQAHIYTNTHTTPTKKAVWAVPASCIVISPSACNFSHQLFRALCFISKKVSRPPSWKAHCLGCRSYEAAGLWHLESSLDLWFVRLRYLTRCSYWLNHDYFILKFGGWGGGFWGGFLSCGCWFVDLGGSCMWAVCGMVGLSLGPVLPLVPVIRPAS